APALQRPTQDRCEAVVAVACIRMAGIEHMDVIESAQSLLQSAEIALAALQDLTHPAQLRSTEGCVDGAHPVIDPERGNVVHPRNGSLRVRSVHAEGARLPHPFGQLGVPGYEHPPVARGDVLDRVEGETTHIADQADMRTPVAGADRQGAVL